VVSGDRAKARSALASGSTQIGGLDFVLFLGNQLVEAASIFDRKHSHDPLKLRTVCNEANEAVNAAETLLKDTPDKDKEDQVKKLEDQIKTALKAV
jgi:hypothetical protein